MPSREGSRVFVGNLPHHCRDRDLNRFFEKYGRVRNVFIKSGRYGFCEFDDYRDADDAVYELNGRDLLGVRVTVEHARGPRRERYGGRGGDRRRIWVDKYGPPTRTRHRLIVENLSSKVSWQDLKDLMRRAGEVTYANAHNDKRNEGVVEFASAIDVDRAIEKFDDYEVHGKRIKLFKDRSSESRSRSRSRSSDRRGRRRNSRSRSRSRRRSSRRSASRSKSRSMSRSNESVGGSKSPSLKKDVCENNGDQSVAEDEDCADVRKRSRSESVSDNRDYEEEEEEDGGGGESKKVKRENEVEIHKPSVVNEMDEEVVSHNEATETTNSMEDN